MPELTYTHPVLLGPVRVETRYRGKALLVRVFPDEWQVDKFESLPTAAEIASLDAYWTAYWRAAGVPTAEQVAWHELTARVPAGRATWLLQGHRPANPDDRPTGVTAGSAVLVVVSPAALPAADRQPTITYWTAVWCAHGDRDKLRDADIALLAAVGSGRAEAIRARRPSGVDSAPVTPSNDVTVSFLVLAPPAKLATQSWTVAAKASLLPDNFVFYGYFGGNQVFAEPGLPVKGPLAVSPDPGETKESQLKVDEDTGELRVPASLRWLVDFQAAVDAGMGIRIGFTEKFTGDLDRLVVLGLRARTSPEQSAADLGGLWQDQVRTPNGFALLPQGTATNNTEDRPAGQDPRTGADAARRAATRLAATTDWTAKTDGQWLADLVGVDPGVLLGVPNADATDRRDARAANTALWPATWGHYLRALLNGVLTDEQIASTRQFFVEHVSGRGPLPAVQIGRQPYGILPTTVFGKLAWPDTDRHRIGLNHVLTEAAADWQRVVDHVNHLGKPGQDPHQQLLDILALHPTSAEYHQRYANSVEDLFNREGMRGKGPALMTALDQELGMPLPIRALLARFGFTGADPDLVRRLFTDVQLPLPGPLVDDRPLSENALIRAYTADGKNYLRWLHDFGGDLDRIRLEQGFVDGKPPSALLYLLARHALLLTWADAARRLTGADDIRDAPFIHVKQAPVPSESRYRTLYAPAPAVTGDPAKLAHEYIGEVLATEPAAAELREQLAALDILADLPTARLERVLAEHVDLATHRLDAWRLGLVNERLEQLRFGDGTTPVRRGVHLGAYGYLEDLTPGPELGTKAVPADLATVFGTDPIPCDTRNGGYVHAPSPAHARTAAVLRAGHLANRAEANKNAFAVNLSSDRVRIALTMLDGLRQGQSLGALLGYRFERGLHDRHGMAEVDAFITGLRGKFPLRAKKIDTTKAENAEIGLVEARNVIDGLGLLKYLDQDGVDRTYPFGLDGLKDADKDQKAAIGLEIDALRNVHDALADLAVAESTHQALQGNPERASATLDAYAKEGFPPDPDVVKTPRSGVTLTHRLGLQFTPGLGPDHGAPLLGRNNPRARAEPAVNDWLAPTVLPHPDEVAALVTWTDPVSEKDRSRVVTQEEAGLQPLDLLSALRPSEAVAMTDLDDRILGVVFEQAQPRPDAEVTIQYTRQVSGKISFFELSPLVTALRSLLTTARPLRPSDLVPGAGSAAVDRSADDTLVVPRERAAAVQESLEDFGADIAEYVVDLARLYPQNGPPIRADVLSGIDDLLARYAGLSVAAGGFGLVRSGWGELAAWRREVFRDVLKAVADTGARLHRALDAADDLITQYGKLPASTSDEERYRILQQAERLLTTAPANPRPSTPAKLRIRVSSLRAAFDTRVTGLDRIAGTSRTTLSGLLADVQAKLPLTDVDPAGLDLTPFGDRVVAFGRELLARARALADEVGKRGAAVQDALVLHDKAVTPADRLRAVTDALKAALGEDVLVVPQFTAAEALADELGGARGDSGKILAHLERDFPVDDWLHGMARVREKPRLWEKTVLLADALLGPGGGVLGTGILDWEPPELTPLQLPFFEDEQWLGLEFDKTEPDRDPLREDRLLYTAHYAASHRGDQCGLVLDEWTEVLPAERETTGIAVHFDRPDAEPPQSMLLVVPPVPTGTWTPDDLLEAITGTIELAKTRAVEPAHLEDSAYAHLLPAAVLSAVRDPITIGTDLAVSTLRWKAAHD